MKEPPPPILSRSRFNPHTTPPTPPPLKKTVRAAKISAGGSAVAVKHIWPVEHPTLKSRISLSLFFRTPGRPQSLPFSFHAIPQLSELPTTSSVESPAATSHLRHRTPTECSKLYAFCFLNFVTLFRFG